MRNCLRYMLLALLYVFQPLTTSQAATLEPGMDCVNDGHHSGKLSRNIVPTPRIIREDESKEIRIKRIVGIVDPNFNLKDEGYVVECKGAKVILKACSEKGIAHARASLAQLCGVGPADMMNDQAFTGKVINKIYIEDYPAFPFRGFMHDTGRNFREVETLKKELDLMAFYKINVFHWHLTDNPAWRIECKAFPQLNDPQYQRKGRDEGRYYSYGQIRDVIAYAAERGIMVIPEIDMPGHSQYFNTTFGFPMASEEGMKVLEVCLKEFMNEIPAESCPYIHIGSDEVRVEDPEGFMRFCEKVVMDGGRTPIAWLPGLPASDGTIAQIWTEKGRQTIGNDFAGVYLDSYMGYLNLSVPLLNTSRYFMHELCGAEGADGKAMGGVLCLWNDVRSDDKERIFPHNGMPEGLLGYAESGWVGGDRDGCDAHDRLVEFEKKISLHRDKFLTDWNVRWVANAHIPWNVEILCDAQASENECVEGELRKNVPVEKRLLAKSQAWGGCVDVNAICRSMGIVNEKALLTDDKLTGVEARLTTELYVERDTVITAWIGFDSPARSNRRSDGIGEQGRWEYSARVFVKDANSEAQGREIFPSKPWNEPGMYRYHHNTWNKEPNELPYTDEQFFWMREPAVVPLKAGWNMIEIRVPCIQLSRTWMSAFVPVTVHRDGRVGEATGIFNLK